jgi:hypothetical protein
MRALCPTCGLHHEVVRVLEDGHGEEHKDVYQLAPLEGCERSWISDTDLLEARAKFGQDAIVAEPEDDEL